MIYPVITLYQPWATWIMRGWKTIETRTHNRFASLEGKTILIHAGMRTDDSPAATQNPYLTREMINHNPDEMVNGGILGSVHVHAFGECMYSNSFRALIDCAMTQRWGLFLSDIKKFEIPIACMGEMGIWYYDLDNKLKIRKPS